MDLSFQEKSILGSLVITLGLFGYYFFKVFEVFMYGTSETSLSLPFILIGVVAAVVAVEIVYHILIALASKPETEDERDKLIEAKATRISYFVLAAGCLTAVGHSMISVFAEDSALDRTIQNPIMTANLIILAFILAEVVGFAMQLYYYRRGF